MVKVRNRTNQQLLLRISIWTLRCLLNIDYSLDNAIALDKRHSKTVLNSRIGYLFPSGLCAP